MSLEDVYTENGFKDQDEYFDYLADNYGVDIKIVRSLADILGPVEDFDALVTQLEDYEANL